MKFVKYQLKHGIKGINFKLLILSSLRLINPVFIKLFSLVHKDFDNFLPSVYPW